MPAVERPVGPPVDATPATRPGPVVLEGRFGRVEKLDAARHGASLWNAVKGHDHIWTYMSSYGPFADEAAFSDWLGEPRDARGPLLLRDRRCLGSRRRHRDAHGNPPGHAGVRGRPHRLFAGLAADAARHRGAVFACPLRVRDARLPALRMEVQFAQRAPRAAPPSASASCSRASCAST